MEYNKMLAKLINGEHLSLQEAESAIASIFAGEYSPAQIAGLLVALRVKGETAEEIAGFVRSLRRHAIPIPSAPHEVFDTCGTGGDGMQTFNISTAAALVVAACGVRVAKHGNRSVSSICGSADVLEALGVNINLTPEQAGKCVEEVGIVFLFAPLYHPAFAKVGPVRKELGVRTIFNFLGPLVNPALPRRQIIGVSDRAKMQPIAEALMLLGSERVMMVRSRDGHDELTTTAPAEICEVSKGSVKYYELDPAQFCFVPCSGEDLKGGNAEENAAIIRSVLSGKQGPRLDTVLLNSGAALYTAGKAQDIGKGIARAMETIRSGEAMRLLDRFVHFTQSVNN